MNSKLFSSLPSFPVSLMKLITLMTLMASCVPFLKFYMQFQGKTHVPFLQLESATHFIL